MISSVFIIELLVRITINHPTYNIEKKLYGLRKSNNGITEIYYPHSRFWASEGGYSTSLTNNLGLPGSDVIVTDSTEYIYVLGSSYVQANQVEPSKVSTSVLQSKLGIGSRYQVLNLGDSGLDQYDSYFRLKYYEKFYKPFLIMLVIERADDRWLARHDTLDFLIEKNAGEEVYQNPLEINLGNLRKYSSVINVLANGFKISTKMSFRMNKIISTVNDPNLTPISNISQRLLICLKKFNEEYKSKFFAVSVINNLDINNYINEYCKSNGINFIFSPINRSENKLKKNGHLNEKGNRELGEILFKTINENVLDKTN